MDTFHTPTKSDCENENDDVFICFYQVPLRSTHGHDRSDTDGFRQRPKTRASDSAINTEYCDKFETNLVNRLLELAFNFFTH